MVPLGGLTGATMSDMGTFRIQIEIENPALPGNRRTLENVLVDTGAELTGARSLEGLNLRVEPANRRLVDAGPAPAAALTSV
jgi:hypothetical protein